MPHARLPDNGHVSLAEEFAKKYGLPLSHIKTAPGESVYTLDGFHQLHYLVSTSKPSVERTDSYSQRRIREAVLHPGETKEHHVLYCLDYIRQELMCNVDLSLNHLGTDFSSITGAARMCRDFDAVTRRVADHAWDRDTWGDHAEVAL